jgi:hypothetical protein
MLTAMDDLPIRLSWVGVVVGLLVGGPIGALIGWLIGRKLDKRREQRRLEAEAEGMRSDVLIAAVVALGAKLSKADGRVSEPEIRAFKKIFAVSAADGPEVARMWDEARRSPFGYEAQAWELAQARSTWRSARSPPRTPAACRATKSCFWATWRASSGCATCPSRRRAGPGSATRRPIRPTSPTSGSP